MSALPYERRRPAPPPAASATLLRWLGEGTLFLCGVCVWVFKMKSDSGGEDGLLPYSPLQVLIPMLGLFSALWVLMFQGARIPRLTVPGLPTTLFWMGVAGIITGVLLHIGEPTNQSDVLLYLVRWMMPLCFLLFLYVARETGCSAEALLLGIAAGAILSVLAVEATRAGLPVPVSPARGGRYSGFLNHPNQYGIIISTTSPIIMLFLKSRRWWWKLIGAVLIPVYLIALFECLSKTNIVLSFLSLIGCSLALSLGNRRRIFTTLTWTCVLAVVMAGGAVVAFGVLAKVAPREAKVIEDAFVDPTEANSIDSREVIWAAAVDEIKAHPFAGVGPSRVTDVLGGPHAHNVLLQLYLQGGIISFCGMCLLISGVIGRALALLVATFRGRRELNELEQIRMVSALAILIYSLANFMSDAFNTATMTTFVPLMGLAFAIRLTGEQDHVAREGEVKAPVAACLQQPG